MLDRERTRQEIITILRKRLNQGLRSQRTETWPVVPTRVSRQTLIAQLAIVFKVYKQTKFILDSNSGQTFPTPCQTQPNLRQSSNLVRITILTSNLISYI